MKFLSNKKDAKPQNYTSREAMRDFSPPCVTEELSSKAQRTALAAELRAISRATGLICGAERELRLRMDD